jgi:hypothetical protein
MSFKLNKFLSFFFVAWKKLEVVKDKVYLHAMIQLNLENTKFAVFRVFNQCLTTLFLIFSSQFY